MEKALNSQIVGDSPAISKILKKIYEAFKTYNYYSKKGIKLDPITSYKKGFVVSDGRIHWKKSAILNKKIYDIEASQKIGDDAIDVTMTQYNSHREKIGCLFISRYNGETGDKLADISEVRDYSQLLLLKHLYPSINNLIKNVHNKLTIAKGYVKSGIKTNGISMFGRPINIKRKRVSWKIAGIIKGKIFSASISQKLNSDKSSINISQFDKNGERIGSINIPNYDGSDNPKIRIKANRFKP